MSEYMLDKVQYHSPSEIVGTKAAEYQSQYNGLLDGEQSKTAELTKKINRSKGHSTILFSRMFVCMVLAVLFLASNVWYSGFAVNHTVGLAILALIALMLFTGCICFVLAIFRIMYFRTVFIMMNNMLMLYASILAAYIAVSFKMYGYFAIMAAILWAWVFSYFWAIKSEDFSISMQIVLSFLSFVVIILFFIIWMFALNGNDVEHSDTWCDRELYSRFAMYEITDTQGERSAKFSSALLTAKDLLSWGDMEVYKINDTLTNEVKIIDDILLFIQDDIFKGDENVTKTINDAKSFIMTYMYQSDSDAKNEIKVTAVGTGAFRNATSIKTVVLPESITSIEAGAFDGSAVRKVDVYAPEIHIKGSLEGSTVSIIRLLSPYATKIVIEDVSALPENITFWVPEDLVWDCRSINPEIADYIIALQ